MGGKVSTYGCLGLGFHENCWKIWCFEPYYAVGFHAVYAGITLRLKWLVKLDSNLLGIYMGCFLAPRNICWCFELKRKIGYERTCFSSELSLSSYMHKFFSIYIPSYFKIYIKPTLHCLAGTLISFYLLIDYLVH